MDKMKCIERSFYMPINNRFVVREYNLPHHYNGKVFEEKVIGIGLLDPEINIILPSPLTNYIRSNFTGQSGSLNSQRNGASELTKFLNYISQQINDNDPDFIELKKTGLFGLNLIHGSEYITYNSIRSRNGEISSGYVYRLEYYLKKFYKWLKKNSIIDYAEVEDNSPFNDLELGTVYPNRDENVSNKLVDFGENRWGLVKKFIAISKVVAPEISLGICFQFFGGLRVGEIVNLTKDAIESPYYWSNDDVGSNKFILKVRDRHKEIFINKKNLQHEQVKRPRNQALIVSQLLSTIYKEHKTLLEKVTQESSSINPNALFISPRTKNVLTGKAYKDRFQKVKKAFLEHVSEDDYMYLIQKDWSTHIGRGVFTNLLLDLGASVSELAIARGDKNINSALAYVEEFNALQLTSEAVNALSKQYSEEVKKAYDNQNANIPENINAQEYLYGA